MNLRYTVLIVSPDGKRLFVASRHTDSGDAERAAEELRLAFGGHVRIYDRGADA